MARKICRVCGKAVPQRARRCPHCGAEPKGTQKASVGATMGVLGCLVPFVVFLILATIFIL